MNAVKMTEFLTEVYVFFQNSYQNRQQTRRDSVQVLKVGLYRHILFDDTKMSY